MCCVSIGPSCWSSWGSSASPDLVERDWASLERGATLLAETSMYPRSVKGGFERVVRVVWGDQISCPCLSLYSISRLSLFPHFKHIWLYSNTCLAGNHQPPFTDPWLMLSLIKQLPKASCHWGSERRWFIWSLPSWVDLRGRAQKQQTPWWCCAHRKADDRHVHANILHPPLLNPYRIENTQDPKCWNKAECDKNEMLACLLHCHFRDICNLVVCRGPASSESFGLCIGLWIATQMSDTAL